jgi:hypothetical protein
MKRSVVILATAVCLLAVVLPAHAGKKMASVDAWISAGSGRVGVGVISATGAWQTLSRVVNAPDTLSLDIGADVSGGRSAVKFRGPTGSSGFTVTYLSAKGDDITRQVTHAGFRVFGVKNGGSAKIKLVVQVKAWAEGTQEFAVTVTTSGGADRVVASIKAV